jgi:hypothetical protein
MSNESIKIYPSISLKTKKVLNGVLITHGYSMSPFKVIPYIIDMV